MRSVKDIKIQSQCLTFVERTFLYVKINLSQKKVLSKQACYFRSSNNFTHTD